MTGDDIIGFIGANGTAYAADEVAWIVTADGLRVGGPFDDQEDAEDFASVWNSAYPPPEHTEFVVEQITAEEASHLDRRNV